MVPPDDSVNQQMQLTEQDSIDRRIQEERDRELKPIESDVKDLAETFLILQEQMQEQRENLNLVEKSVESSRAHAEKANEYLEKTSETKNKTRHFKKCTALGGVIGLVGSAAGFVFFPPGAALTILVAGTALGLGAGAGAGLAKKA